MPIENGVGYGELTALKIEHLSKIMGMHLAITQAVLNKFPHFNQQYRFIDMTAGKGINPNDVSGSPIVFLEQVFSEAFRLPFRADFIERSEKNLEELKTNIEKVLPQSASNHHELNFMLGNYEEVIPKLLAFQNTKEFGLIFVDPSGEVPDFETLKFIAQKRPKMEILIYLAATNVKRVHHFTEKLLSDHMMHIGKKHWLIRKPIPWDSHKWTFLLGSNTSIFKDYKKIDFLRLDSDEAQDFFPKLNLTKKQIQDKIQPSLF
jgi:three-Cys-motif partner protein